MGIPDPQSEIWLEGPIRSKLEDGAILNKPAMSDKEIKLNALFQPDVPLENPLSGQLPHKYKLVIPGNHELGFEDGEEMSEKQMAGLNMLGINKAYELLSNCTYLCDRSTEVYGIKIYGTPWHSMPGYSFYRPRGQKILHKWNQIPPKTDVLITHTPPLGHGDFNSWEKMDGILAGDVELLNTVEQRVVPKYHVFGHVHQV
ncbi:hypothetical protein TELCIR_10158 [Teladorsagia circumcincta]|uniref:Calcineurin-like phosphoesterase domain-containing protein n=1 Tax=Teladorsagia circumcincta TaxID=45464 RepID=A0A2G9UF08_TELCI|nr:hypothetical protein TELCIR_10158 [Teladorsagia circumcincta]